jgi:hypothetical protein
MISTILSFVAGFLTGALVFRNNQAKAEKIVADVKAAADKAKDAVEDLKK